MPSCWSALKLAAVVFVLAVAVHFAAPAPAAASCSCTTPRYVTSTETGTGASCAAAQSDLNAKLLGQENQCASQDPCDYTQTITNPCALVGATYEISGYDHYLCEVGNTCP
jgi:hypothetical protein